MTPRKPFNPDQFSLHFSTVPKYAEGEDKLHLIEAREPKYNQKIGSMLWDAQQGHILRIQVNRDVARKGLGTEMWHEGHRLARESTDVMPPSHSKDRTLSGELWARSVGGGLPPNKNENSVRLANEIKSKHPRGGKHYTQWDDLSPVIRDTEKD